MGRCLWVVEPLLSWVRKTTSLGFCLSWKLTAGSGSAPDWSRRPYSRLRWAFGSCHRPRNYRIGHAYPLQRSSSCDRFHSGSWSCQQARPSEGNCFRHCLTQRSCRLSRTHLLLPQGYLCSHCCWQWSRWLQGSTSTACCCQCSRTVCKKNRS